MADKKFEESGMVFLFDDQKVFLPEKETAVKNIQHVKACDFICLYKRKRRHELCFIEAKSSAPYETESLQDYLQKVHDQFCHGLLFFMSLLLGRQSFTSPNIPPAMEKLTLLEDRILFVLVVCRHRKEWLQNLQEALRNKLKGISNAFAIQDVMVVNEQIAGKFGIVQNNAET